MVRRSKSLELDRINPRDACGVDHPPRQVEILIVSNFSDDIARLTFPDELCADLDCPHGASRFHPTAPFQEQETVALPWTRDGVDRRRHAVQETHARQRFLRAIGRSSIRRRQTSRPSSSADE